MIKIIKAGQKEFIGFCDRCGCEFTYELDDLKLSCSSDKVNCPTCGKDYYHSTKNKEHEFATKPPYKLPDITWPPNAIEIETINDPCAGCSWRSELLTRDYYVGDTPCDFCSNNPNKVTCLQTSVNTADCPKDVYRNATSISEELK